MDQIVGAVSEENEAAIGTRPGVATPDPAIEMNAGTTDPNASIVVPSQIIGLTANAAET